jgi:hypothetical protein
VAWPRLVAYRSGGGKARNQRIHPCTLLPGRCHARSCFHAPRKGMNGPQLAVGVLGTRNTRLFRGDSPGNVPQGRRLFLRSFCVLLHFLKPYIQRCRAFAAANSLYIRNNTVVFLHLVLRQTTRTLFSSQGATAIFLLYRRKTVMQGLKPQSPHHCLLRGVACGGLKPCSVMSPLYFISVQLSLPEVKRKKESPDSPLTSDAQANRDEEARV